MIHDTNQNPRTAKSPRDIALNMEAVITQQQLSGQPNTHRTGEFERGYASCQSVELPGAGLGRQRSVQSWDPDHTRT